MELLFIFVSSAVFVAALAPAYRATQLAYSGEIPYPEAFSIWIAPLLCFFVGFPVLALSGVVLTESRLSAFWLILPFFLFVIALLQVSKHRQAWAIRRFDSGEEIALLMRKSARWAVIALLPAIAMDMLMIYALSTREL